MKRVTKTKKLKIMKRKLFQFTMLNIAIVAILIYGCSKDDDENPESNQPSSCPGLETITYGGQLYNTVLIGNQCWLKENLNIGEMIPGDDEMQNNSIIEKYCYDDNPANCDKYGGLYRWDEMMQYVTQEGAKGICPDGWHIPTDEEWKMLEGHVDSRYPDDDSMWHQSEIFRGYDAGERLKMQNDWYNNGNGTDLFGFSALPGGYGGYIGNFNDLGENGYFWSSTENDSNNPWHRRLSYNSSKVARVVSFEGLEGYSVRCVSD